MRCFRKLLLPMIVLSAWLPVRAQTPEINLGKTPTQEEIQKWDIAIGPEGKELPPGSGTAVEGAKVFAQNCAVCHGPTAEGTELAPRLVGGVGTLGSPLAAICNDEAWPRAGLEDRHRFRDL